MEKTFSLDLTLAQRKQLWHGVGLLDQGDAFAAHECFEHAFRASQGAVQTFFRGLTQLCASYHQLCLGRGRAARSTRAKAFRNLALVDLLSVEFQQRVNLLFERLGAHEDCGRFIEVDEAPRLRAWPVPDILRPQSEEHLSALEVSWQGKKSP